MIEPVATKVDLRPDGYDRTPPYCSHSRVLKEQLVRGTKGDDEMVIIPLVKRCPNRHVWK